MWTIEGYFLNNFTLLSMIYYRPYSTNIQLHRDAKYHKLRWNLYSFRCNCEYDSSTMLRVYVNQNNSYAGRQYTFIDSYYSIIC